MTKKQLDEYKSLIKIYGSNEDFRHFIDLVNIRHRCFLAEQKRMGTNTNVDAMDMLLEDFRVIVDKY